MRTLRNPDKSPFLSAAAMLRGFRDILESLLEQMGQIVLLLEKADAWLCKTMGKQWWDGMEEETEAKPR